MDNSSDSYIESFVDDEGVFFEEELESPESDVSVHEYVEEFIEGEGGIDDMQETLEYIEEDLEGMDEDHGEELLPGSFVSKSDADSEEEVETDYANDGDLSKFMDYVYQIYPANIPQHDGESISGCERAVSFLDKLNSEMSRAVRDDSDNSIDLSVLEDVRLNVMKDIMVLKNHLGKLKKKFKDSHKKNATEDIVISKDAEENVVPAWISRSGAEVEYSELTKEASTPNNMVIAVTAFERAISGIMINAHVSAGNDMEEVYGFLNKKYDITPREELSIMQVVADSGYHIFKDRGTYGPGDSKEKDTNNRGVDFIKNYFA